MRSLFLPMILSVFVLLIGCSLNEQKPSSGPVPDQTEDSNKEEQISADEFATTIVSLLKNKDFTSLSEKAHPIKGIRFTPYAYVRDDVDLTFTQEQIKAIWQNETVYTWGEFDGTGDPINLTFKEYYGRFVYDVDFSQAEETSTNYRLGKGNSLDNSQEFYPDGTVIEFYISGVDPKYEGMDWRSLRIVVEQMDGKWYVVGIIHDQWTI